MRVNEMTQSVLFTVADVFHLGVVFRALSLSDVVQSLSVALRYEPVIFGV
jgi:hypothetical protein